MYKYISIIIVLISLIGLSEGVVKRWVTNGAGDWSVGANWNPTGVPTLNDDMTIAIQNATVTYSVPALSNTITVGSTTISSNLVGLNQMDGNTMTINKGSTFVSQTNSQFNIQDMSNYGTVTAISLFNSQTLVKNYNLFQSAAPSAMYGLINNGVYVANQYHFILTNFWNYGSGFMSFESDIEVKGLDGGYAFNTRFVEKSQTFIKNSNWFSSCDTFSAGYATLQVDNSNLIINQPVPGYDVYFNPSNNSTMTFKNSFLYLNGSHLINSNNATFTLSSSNMTTYKSVLLLDSSNTIFNSGSIIEMNNYFLSNNTATLNVTDSSILYNQSDFLAIGQSKINVVNSLITFAPTPIGTQVGMFNDSQINFDKASVFDVQGIFYGAHRSFTNLSGLSRFNCKSIFALVNNATLNVENSMLVVTGNLTAFDNSIMTFNGAQVESDGQLSFGGSSNFLIASSSVATRDIFLVTVSSQGRIVDSKVTTGGSMLIAGKVSMENSLVTVTGAFGNTGSTLLSANTHLSVEGGVLTNAGVFSGSNATVELKVGDIVNQDSGNFTCSGCTIIITNGNFLTFKTASVSLTNSLLVNSHGVFVSQGDIIATTGTTLNNQAEFYLSSNIKYTGTSPSDSFTNTGLLSINGTSVPSVGIPVVNSGQVNIKNDAHFDNFVQTNGSTTISNSSVSFTADLNLAGGNLAGNGSVVGNFANSGGSLGSTSINNLTITGNYNQSAKGELHLIAGNHTNSVITIGGNATLNGTLVIRILPDNTDPKTTTLLTAPNIQGQFNNVRLIVYDPDSGKETPADDCKYKSQTSGSKLELLVSAGSCQGTGSSPIATGAVIGIVVGCVVGAAVVGVIIHQRKKIPKHLTLRHRLKVLQKEVEIANSKA